MRVLSITHLTFQALVGDELADTSPAGCSWYSLDDRSAVGIIFVDPTCELFRFRVMRLTDQKWKVTKSKLSFETFEGVEAALHDAMSGGPDRPILVKDVPARLRFGKRPSLGS